MGNVYLTTGAEDEDERENQVYDGVYLWALVRREKINSDSQNVRVTRRQPLRETLSLPPETVVKGEGST